MMSVNRLVSVSIREGSAHIRPAVICTPLALAALVLGVFPTPARAAPILQVQNSSALAGGAGSFDVVLTVTEGTFQVSGFSVDLTVPSGSGVTFTGASINTTTAPYIFTTLQAPPLTFATFPTTDFTASDSSMTSPGYVTLSAPPSRTVGLEHVSYAVAPGTHAGPVTVSIVSGNKTQLLDLNANTIPFTPTNGTIAIDTAVVPEPSSLLTGIIAAACLVVLRRRRGKGD
jgi:hypothetical protein